MKGHRPVTEFDARVYAATKRIQRGKVTTYKQLARAVGCGTSQAVGQALSRNPFAPVVPCHRVIASDLTIGGFNGATSGASIRRKKAMLQKEGVRFEGNRLADEKQLFAFR